MRSVLTRARNLISDPGAMRWHRYLLRPVLPIFFGFQNLSIKKVIAVQLKTQISTYHSIVKTLYTGCSSSQAVKSRLSLCTMYDVMYGTFSSHRGQVQIPTRQPVFIQGSVKATASHTASWGRVTHSEESVICPLLHNIRNWLVSLEYQGQRQHGQFHSHRGCGIVRRLQVLIGNQVNKFDPSLIK